MTTARYLIRWLPTFLAFPPAGLLVSVALGPVDSPPSVRSRGRSPARPRAA